MIETVFLAASQVITYINDTPLTNGSGFFFERQDKLFYITSRHVLLDEDSEHFPNRIVINLHAAEDNLTELIDFSIPLYRDGKSDWREGRDSADAIDVAAIEIERSALPERAVHHAFGPEHIARPGSSDCPVVLGSPVLILGFPLGFHDTLHHVPVARQAIVASSFGFRFNGRGYFLTDGRTHRGSSGSPVIMRTGDGSGPAGKRPWTLLGIHSARLDLSTRDTEADEGLGLNCSWYADILMPLTEARPPASESGEPD